MKELKDKVVLIGMPGCGKSTFGKLLSAEINYNFYDMDTYVEEISDNTVEGLFNIGEEVFRNWESKACRELVQKKRALISSGGGVVKREENVKLLRKNSIVIFIDRPLNNIIEDIEVESRPLLKNSKERLYNLYNERYDLYKRAAHITIVNDGYIKEAIDKCKSEIKALIKE